MREQEVLEWAIAGVHNAIKNTEMGLDRRDIDELKSKWVVLNRKLQRAKSFKNSGEMED